MANNEGKTRYSDEELEEFRVLILDKLAKAKADLSFTEGQLMAMADNDDSKFKGLDDGSTSAEIDRLSTLKGRQQKYISHLENALIRIDNKVYGICRETGKLIQKERLRAVPHATLSIEVKQKASHR